MTRCVRIVLSVLVAAVATFGLATPVLAQWPTSCVDLNDIVEAHLGNDGNVGIYQRVFGDQAEQGCQNDHRDDVRGVFGWVFDQAAQSEDSETQDLAWPTDCVELNDIVENHLGNHSNVGIYQRTFGRQAETACRNDHREDVRGVFGWAFGGATTSAVGPPLSINELVKRSQAAVRYIRPSDDRCGSAFVVTADGYVVTNSHVLDGARQAIVGTHDGQEQQVSVVADDPEADLALLKLPGSGHPFLPFGSSARLELGEDLVILGYPLCLETLTVTRGVLSARHPGWLQTDATANPGNSGGPAFNTKGGVIGVVIGKLGGGVVEGVESANFLIDGDIVRHIVDDWITHHRASSLPELAPIVKWSSVSGGDEHVCGIRTNGTVVCWGKNDSGQASAPAATFQSVSAGSHYTCGIRTNSTVVCWGVNTHAPAGTFQTVSAFGSYACGVRSNGAIACWGFDLFGGASGAPAGTFQSVSLGGYACGVRTNETIACWGEYAPDEASVPAGTFQSVSVGSGYACGVQTIGTIACWGENTSGKASAPAGIFQSVSAGAIHSCGVQTNGTITCWGANVWGQASAPAGTFQSVSAGRTHTCGVRTNGSIDCWGGNWYGQATPPA